MSATSVIRERLRLRYEPIAFSTPERAKDFVNRCATSMRVVLGDYDEDADRGVAWVVCPADAERLIRAGYEMA